MSLEAGRSSSQGSICGRRRAPVPGARNGNGYFKGKAGALKPRRNNAQAAGLCSRPHSQVPSSPHCPDRCTFPMRRWSRNSASSLHSSQALSSSTVGKEIPDTLCSVSGVPDNLHMDDEFYGRTWGVKVKVGRTRHPTLLQSSSDTFGVSITGVSLSPLHHPFHHHHHEENHNPFAMVTTLEVLDS